MIWFVFDLNFPRFHFPDLGVADSPAVSTTRREGVLDGPEFLQTLVEGQDFPATTIYSKCKNGTYNDDNEPCRPPLDAVIAADFFQVRETCRRHGMSMRTAQWKSVQQLHTDSKRFRGCFAWQMKYCCQRLCKPRTVRHSSIIRRQKGDLRRVTADFFVCFGVEFAERLSHRGLVGTISPTTAVLPAAVRVVWFGAERRSGGGTGGSCGP